MRNALFTYLGLAALWIAGCETAVDPVTGTQKAYTLFGRLSPETDTQFVQVYPIQERLAPIDTTDTELQVGATDLATDSTFIFERGHRPDAHTGLVFQLLRPLEYGHTYRVFTRGPERGTTFAEVPVPPLAKWDVRDPKTIGSVRVPIRLLGSPPRLINTTVEYVAKFGPGGISPETVDTVRLDYDGRQQPIDNGWRIPLNLSKDFDLIHEELASRGRRRALTTWGLALLSIRIRLMVVNEAWNPKNEKATFDPEVLVQPGTMSNVENGFGFVGAGYWMDRPIRVRQEVLSEAGYRDPYSYQDEPRY